MGAMSGHLDTCKKLVAAGAEIDARDSLGRSEKKSCRCTNTILYIFIRRIKCSVL
jgi:hypothetical protein